MWASWGAMRAPKGKVPGRSARTFLTIEDLEHSAKELGLISVQRRLGGTVGLVQSTLIIRSYAV